MIYCRSAQEGIAPNGIKGLEHVLFKGPRGYGAVGAQDSAREFLNRRLAFGQGPDEHAPLRVDDSRRAIRAVPAFLAGHSLMTISDVLL